MSLFKPAEIQPLRRDPITQVIEARSRLSTSGRWVSADCLWRFYRDKGGWRIAAVSDNDYRELMGRYIDFYRMPYTWRRDLLRNHKLTTSRFEALKEAVWLLEQIMANIDEPTIEEAEKQIATPTSEIDIDAILKLTEEELETQSGSLPISAQPDWV